MFGFDSLFRRGKQLLARGAGYFEIDHTNSPGTAAVPGGTKLERDIVQCRHCQRGVVLNPGRVRNRAYCPKCHAYICDKCERMRVAAGGACVPFMLQLDRVATLLEKHIGQPDHPDLIVLSDPASMAYEGPPRVTLS